jgi:hypothetical protein
VIGLDGGATRDSFGRRTPEGVAPGPVGHPIVTGATAYGLAAVTLVLAITALRFGPGAAPVGTVTGEPQRLVSATVSAVGEYIAFTGLHVFTLLGGLSLPS